MNFKNDIKEELNEARKKIKDLEQRSIAYETLQDKKKENKRLFIIWIITFVAFVGLLTYTIWLLNDIEVITETESEEYNQSIDNEGSINDSYIINGGGYNDKD